jgi:hypothetical protein
MTSGDVVTPQQRHTTWTCLDCGSVVYGPVLTADCRILVGAAAVR